MMAEDNPFVSLHEVFAIIVNFARRGAAIVKSQHMRRNPLGVKPVADRVSAQRSGEDEYRIDSLSTMQRQSRVGPSAQQSNDYPSKIRDDFLHSNGGVARVLVDVTVGS